jgi:hypothetical protein
MCLPKIFLFYYQTVRSLSIIKRVVTNTLLVPLVVTWENAFFPKELKIGFNISQVFIKKIIN